MQEVEAALVVMLDAIAVFLRRELAGVPFPDIDLQARDAYVFWRGLIRYLKAFLEELVAAGVPGELRIRLFWERKTGPDEPS